MARTLRARLCAQLASVDALARGEGIFHETEPAFFVDGRLVVELAGSSSVGLRLTWPVIRELKPSLAEDLRVEPIRSGTDWIYVTFRRAADLAFVVDLVGHAIPAYLPADGRALRPPPEGADLARLRRFH